MVEWGLPWEEIFLKQGQEREANGELLPHLFQGLAETALWALGHKKYCLVVQVTRQNIEVGLGACFIFCASHQLKGNTAVGSNVLQSWDYKTEYWWVCGGDSNNDGIRLQPVATLQNPKREHWRPPWTLLEILRSLRRLKSRPEVHEVCRFKAVSIMSSLGIKDKPLHLHLRDGNAWRFL